MNSLEKMTKLLPGAGHVGYHAELTRLYDEEGEAMFAPGLTRRDSTVALVSVLLIASLVLGSVLAAIQPPGSTRALAQPLSMAAAATASDELGSPAPDQAIHADGGDSVKMWRPGAASPNVYNYNWPDVPGSNLYFVSVTAPYSNNTDYMAGRGSIFDVYSSSTRLESVLSIYNIKTRVLDQRHPWTAYTTGPQTFSDVPHLSNNTNHWVEIETAVHYGVVAGFVDTATVHPCSDRGVGSPCFLPGVFITRGQVSKTLSIAAQLRPITLDTWGFWRVGEGRIASLVHLPAWFKVLLGGWLVGFLWYGQLALTMPLVWPCLWLSFCVAAFICVMWSSSGCGILAGQREGRAW